MAESFLISHERYPPRYQGNQKEVNTKSHTYIHHKIVIIEKKS